MNAPERFNVWRWEDEDSAKRLIYTPDTKVPNAGTFILGKEDHTIGNLMRMQLLRDPQVRFAGYRIPHPLIFECHIKVQSMDARTTPIDVFESALEDLNTEIDHLEKSFLELLKDFE